MCSVCAKYHIRKWQSMLLNNNWASHTQLFQMTRQNVNSLAKNVIHTIHSLNSCNERNSANNLHTWSSTLGWFFFFFCCWCCLFWLGLGFLFCFVLVWIFFSFVSFVLVIVFKEHNIAISSSCLFQSACGKSPQLKKMNSAIFSFSNIVLSHFVVRNMCTIY